MAVIDYASRIYGQQNKPTATSMTSYNTGDYETLYNQARALPLSGSAAGSADWLANYAQRSAQAQTAGMAPVSFNALLGPDGTFDPNAQIPNMQKTPGEVFTEAQASYLAKAIENRDIARKGIMAAGQDRYQQARMAMEQQMALSDTRGLTAGAAEGARQTLSATQQVALNQIEATTRSELLQLQAQGVQDEFLANEYAQMKLQELEITDSRFGVLSGLMRDYQDASNRNDTDAMEQINKQISIRENEIRTGIVSEEDQKILDNPESSDIEISAAAERQINRVLADPNAWDIAIGVGLVALGVVAVVGSGVLTVASGGTAAALTVPAGLMGKAALVAGISSIAAGFGVVGTDIGQRARNVEQEKNRVNNILKNQRRILLTKGFTNEEIDIAFRARMAQEDPVYRDIIGR